MNKKEL
jgi:non-specific serine/threonine protein kinase